MLLWSDECVTERPKQVRPLRTNSTSWERLWPLVWQVLHTLYWLQWAGKPPSILVALSCVGSCRWLAESPSSFYCGLSWKSTVMRWGLLSSRSFPSLFHFHPLFTVYNPAAVSIVKRPIKDRLITVSWCWGFTFDRGGSFSLWAEKLVYDQEFNLNTSMRVHFLILMPTGVQRTKVHPVCECSYAVYELFSLLCSQGNKQCRQELCHHCELSVAA
jgi:hypothetical protein